MMDSPCSVKLQTANGVVAGLAFQCFLDLGAEAFVHFGLP